MKKEFKLTTGNKILELFKTEKITEKCDQRKILANLYGRLTKDINSTKGTGKVPIKAPVKK